MASPAAAAALPGGGVNNNNDNDNSSNAQFSSASGRVSNNNSNLVASAATQRLMPVGASSPVPLGGSSSSVSAVPAPSKDANGKTMYVHGTSEIRITLQNIVATMNLGTELKLEEIATRARNAEYNPRRFRAVIIRIREPKTTALVFRSGKVVVTGAKSEADSRMAAKRFGAIVKQTAKTITGRVRFKEFKLQNVVASCDLGFPVRLEMLAYQHEKFSRYEPELFPGLVYRLSRPKVVLLVFVSGKVIITGAKHGADIYHAFDIMYPVLSEFKKQPAATEGA